MNRLVKIAVLVVLVFNVLGCDTQNSLDCTQLAGKIISEQVDLAPFNKIVVYQRTRLVIKQGPIQQVTLTTGENLLNEITFKVVDDQLIIKNENGCNLLRDYGITTVYITVPNLTEIRTSTGEDIISDGVLSFPSLTLLSEDSALEDEFNTDGDFRMQLDVEQLVIVSSNLSNFYLTGTATNANLRFSSGDGTIKAKDLVIQNAQIFHRGTNKWQLDVKQNIAGTIAGYGDIELQSRPQTVNVQELWRGRLIIF